MLYQTLYFNRENHNFLSLLVISPFSRLSTPFGTMVYKILPGILYTDRQPKKFKL